MLVVVILANGLLQNIFQPIAFGATLKLNPLAVLIVTIGAGCLFGMIGMVLAAPLTLRRARSAGSSPRRCLPGPGRAPGARPAGDAACDFT